MSETGNYLFVILQFFIGIVLVLLLIVILHQSNTIGTLRRDLASCSAVRENCISQLGCFYVDPEKKLMEKRSKHVSKQPTGN